MNSNLAAKANSYKSYTRTLSASTWNVQSGAVYVQYSITIDAITKKSDICITLPNNENTPDAVIDWINASVMPGPQYDGQIILHAYGTKPTHDIVILVLVGSDTIDG